MRSRAKNEAMGAGGHGLRSFTAKNERKPNFSENSVGNSSGPVQRLMEQFSRRFQRLISCRSGTKPRDRKKDILRHRLNNA
jgi:hypothetical protein